VAHMQITAETIYDSAQRNRRLAHECFAAWPATVLLETFDGSYLVPALTVPPGRASNDNPFSN
jgi:hypothetical protein